MKKFFFSIAILFTSYQFSSAQYYLRSGLSSFANNYDEPYLNGTPYFSKEYKTNKVKNVEAKIFDKKRNDYRPTYSMVCSPMGATEGYKSFNKKGEVTYESGVEFIDSVHISKRYYIRKGDTTYTLYSFDSKMNPTSFTYYKKNKVTRRTNLTYNETGKMSKSETFNRKNKRTYYAEYDYYENGSRKQTRSYSGKGKLNYVWNYTCAPEGEQEKKVDQVNYCKRRDYNPDSSYYEVYEATDAKGNAYRQVKKFSKDSLLIESTSFNKKGKEFYRAVYGYDNKRNRNSYASYKKGKSRYSGNSTYNEKGLIIADVFIRGKKQNQYSYEYKYY